MVNMNENNKQEEQVLTEDLVQEIEQDIEEDIQFAENEIQISDETGIDSFFEKKRDLLKKAKIVKQTWSIRELYQKRKEGKLNVDTEYQRNLTWNAEKKVSFIESLFMEIIVPPLYVVEISSENPLEESRYEVVDGKQRLTTIEEFVTNQFRLEEKFLEYFSDIFGGKNYSEINSYYPDEIKQILSYVLDVYVITAKSPDELKYDIFARLNKGATPLRVNELRRALYSSDLTKNINDYIDGLLVNDDTKKTYEIAFNSNDRKRFIDCGRFYRSIAFYYNSKERTGIVENYNSRPREMINSILLQFQKGSLTIEKKKMEEIIMRTIELKIMLNKNHNVGAKSDVEYLIDACILKAVDNMENVKEKLDSILLDQKIKQTLVKSKSTTSNVNARFKRVLEILE